MFKGMNHSLNEITQLNGWKTTNRTNGLTNERTERNFINYICWLPLFLLHTRRHSRIRLTNKQLHPSKVLILQVDIVIMGIS